MHCERRAISKDFSHARCQSPALLTKLVVVHRLFSVQLGPANTAHLRGLVSLQPFVKKSSTFAHMERWGDTSSSRWKRGAVCKSRSHVAMSHSRQCKQRLFKSTVCCTCPSRSTAILQYPVLTVRKVLKPIHFAAGAPPDSSSHHRRF